MISRARARKTWTVETLRVVDPPMLRGVRLPLNSAKWQSIADLPIGAHRGLQHHRGIARE
jgi:hypothetical protein